MFTPLLLDGDIIPDLGPRRQTRETLQPRCTSRFGVSFLPFARKDGIMNMVESGGFVHSDRSSEAHKIDAGGSICMEEKQSSETQEGGATEQPLEDHPMHALMMEEALNFRRLKQGEIIDGEIVSVTPTEVLVHVGAKSEGIVPAKELERLGREGLEGLKPGDVIPVYVVRHEDRDGNLILSIRRAEEEQDWRSAQELHESGNVFEGQVAGFNRGGLIVRMGKLRGFVPASQLAPQHQGNDKQQPE